MMKLAGKDNVEKNDCFTCSPNKADLWQCVMYPDNMVDNCPYVGTCWLKFGEYVDCWGTTCP